MPKDRRADLVDTDMNGWAASLLGARAVMHPLSSGARDRRGQFAA